MFSNPLHVHYLCGGLVWLAIASTAFRARPEAGSGGSELRPPFLSLPAGCLFTQSSYCFFNFDKLITTFSDGCLGSNNDEGRSEMR